MGIERAAAWIDRWRRRPRFPAPLLAVVLPLLLTVGLLLSRVPGTLVPPSPPVPAPRVPAPPAPQPAVEPPTPPPVETAKTGCPRGCAEPPPGCIIKGNISKRTGEKIYHLPGQRYYDRTVISPAEGERWFCTEAEARKNGWRKSKV